MAAISAETWEQINHRDLGVALARVRTALERYVQGERSVFEPPVESEADDGGNRSALATLCAAFRLSPFERDLLVLCAGVELDASFAALCAEAQGDPQRVLPTFSLALAALPGAHWSALTPDAPLLLMQGTCYRRYQAVSDHSRHYPFQLLRISGYGHGNVLRAA